MRILSKLIINAIPLGKPKAGDFLLHSAEDHCEHRVDVLKTNIRYTFPSSIREKIKIPCSGV